MRHANNIRELLRPLGVYRLEGGFQAAEWETVGACLDAVLGGVTYWERETQPAAALASGLERWLSLLPRRPAANTPEGLRTALTALLAIGGESFTRDALNVSLTGCGLPARVDETDVPETVNVFFPGVPGIPADFDAMRAIIEDILPCHLDIRYRFWHLTWAEWETRFPTFRSLDGSGYNWLKIETLVEIL